jgi:hypothetical protein
MFDFGHTQMKPAVVVHTMGRVGSTAIHEPLRRFQGFETYHTHAFSETELDRALRTRTRWDAHLKDSLAVLHGEMPYNPSIRLISIVRDPLARNISAFFNNLPARFADAGTATLIDRFVNHWRHDWPLNWFRQEVKETLGLDVMAEPFDFSRSEQVIANERVSMLVIRAENSDTVKSRNVSEFLGLERRIPIGHANAGSKFGPAYAAFKAEFRAPREMLDMLYGSAFCRHFWTDGERTAMRRKWEKVRAEA